MSNASKTEPKKTDELTAEQLEDVAGGTLNTSFSSAAASKTGSSTVSPDSSTSVGATKTVKPLL